MEKSVDERLFECLMRSPHALRRNFMRSMGFGKEGGCHGMGKMHGHHGPGMHGHHGHKRRMKAFAQERLLSLLQNYEGGVRQKTLVEEMHINPSSVSELISKLEQDGYAIRKVDPEDKRATLITLTELGQARAYELEDERKERFASLFANLTEDEKEQLLTLLEKLLDSTQPETDVEE